ncbi:MAG: TetR/AcrR family transcriptional regulator [Rhodoblastus sp.]|nr:TetR/AcrR family transcriptional regulator [Rhodoblastus sp.]
MPHRRTLLDETVLEGFEAEGMRPAQQARSRELVVRLFNDGLALLRETDFDGLSIEALCARSESTVGAFYSRFENKEAFINALQRVVVAVTRKVIVHGYEAHGAPRDNLEHLVAWIAKGALTWYRRYEGLIRASLRRSNGERDMWTPMRELGELQIAYALPRMLDFLPPGERDGADLRARFAFQMMFGTLNNMVLINPGPLSLEHPTAARMLAAAMTQLIETPFGHSSEGAARRRSG